MMQSLPEAGKPEAEALSASEPTAEAPRQPLTTPAEPMAEAIEEAAADPAATPVEQPAAEPAVDAPDGADFAPMEAPMEPLLEESQPGLITRPAPPRYSPALPPGGEGSAGSKGEAEKGTTEGVDPSSTFAEPPAASRRVLLKLRLVSP